MAPYGCNCAFGLDVAPDDCVVKDGIISRKINECIPSAP
jgi:hypothetical protein